MATKRRGVVARGRVRKRMLGSDTSAVHDHCRLPATLSLCVWRAFQSDLKMHIEMKQRVQAFVLIDKLFMKLKDYLCVSRKH